MGGSGCPHCANAQHVGRISKISMEWINMIKVNRPFLKIEYHIPNTKYYADAFDPDTNTIYEFSNIVGETISNNDLTHPIIQQILNNGHQIQAEISENGLVTLHF